MADASPERDTRHKTPVGAPHDAAERQADRVAEHLTAPAVAGPLRCAACAGGNAPCLWVNSRDLEQVGAGDVEHYAAGQTTGPPAR